MKKHFGKLVAMTLLAVALTGAALAQDSAHMVRASIPFSFYAGGKLEPAGEYTISINAENHMVTITPNATRTGSLLLGYADDASSDGRTVLIFSLVGGEVYALRELRGPELGVSFSSKRLEHAMKVQNQKDQTAVVLAEAR
jgi:hypothetical protein